MSITSKLLASAALALVIAGCNTTGPTPSDRAAGVRPANAPAEASAPTAPSSASSSASSQDTSMTGTAAASSPTKTKADLSGTATGTQGGPQNTATTQAPSPPLAGVALSEVKNPRTTLKGAKVKDVKGEAIGEVKSVRLGSDGKVAAVNVAVGAKTVALQPATLTYVQAENTIASQQTKEEIAK